MNEASLKGYDAGFVTRAVAFVADFVIISLSIIIVNWLAHMLLSFIGMTPGACPALTRDTFFRSLACRIAGSLLVLFSGAFPFLYLLFFWSISGQTPGKYFLGLRVVSADGRRGKLPRALVRLAGYGLSILTLGYGFLRVLVDDRRRGSYDRLARTFVIYDWDAKQAVHFLDRVYQELANLQKPARRWKKGQNA